MSRRRERIVFLTGAGISVESGLKTFRGSGGLWHGQRMDEVATPEAWERDPAAVLKFYDARRDAVRSALPNAAHEAIATLESRYDVVVITQNIDDLHERAGSSAVMHVHGEVLKSRSTIDPRLIYPVSKRTIDIGDLCEMGGQLRPDVVFFGEMVYKLQDARKAMRSAGRVVIVGTSLQVEPIASLWRDASDRSERYLISPDNQDVPPGFELRRGKATVEVPLLLQDWM